MVKIGAERRFEIRDLNAGVPAVLGVAQDRVTTIPAFQ